jgi:hypothetical protein
MFAALLGMVSRAKLPAEERPHQADPESWTQGLLVI